jgi:peptidyl-prolyl cis-trans isomerase SurA
MIKKWLISFCLLGGFSALAQVSPSEVIMTIDEEPIQKQEFEYIFKKNNRDSVISKADLDEYVELFINFKLKVKAAERIELHKDPSFLNELKGYRTQLAKPYLTDSKLTEDLLEEAYYRTANEVKASHILIKVAADALPEDTLKAYNRALSVKKKLGGAKITFEEVAKQYSEDPSAKDNGGNLGYFSAFQMVYPFESTAFKTEVGVVSNPVRTSFGYHLVKVTDKRKTLGKMRLSHIMVSTQGITKKNMPTAETKIKEIETLLASEESFENVAQKYSDDKSTANKGGSMGWITGGKMVESFEKIAFALKEDGEVSAPFKTEYGWHIVRRDEHAPVESFDVLKPALKRKVERDMRAQTTQPLFIQKQKKALGYKQYKSASKKIATALDSTVFDSTFSFANKVDQTKKLFKLDNKVYTTKDYLNWLGSNATPMPLEDNWKSWNQKTFDNFMSEFVMSYVDQRLEANHSDFKLLMNEYRDGILLFELTDSLVWSKATSDSAGLANYFEQHRDDFVWGQRIKVDLYICANGEYAGKVMELLKKDKTANQIGEIINAETKLALKIEEIKYEEGKADNPKELNWELGIVGPFQNVGQYKIYNTTEYLDASNKELHEAKGLITAAYQDYLEQQWLISLKEKHKVSVNKDVLYSIHK